MLVFKFCFFEFHSHQRIGSDWAVCNDAVVAASARAVRQFSYSCGAMKVKENLGEANQNRGSVNNIALVPWDKLTGTGACSS